MNINMKIAYLTGSEDVFGPGEGAATVSVVIAGARLPAIAFPASALNDQTPSPASRLLRIL
jgi:hypothetical protein